MPTKISFTEKNAYIRNMYDANGHKFKMITYANIPLVIGRAAPAKGSAKAATALTVSYTTYSDMCKSTNTSRSLLPLWDSCVSTSNNQVK